jgi:hypothetical protein
MERQRPRANCYRLGLLHQKRKDEQGFPDKSLYSTALGPFLEFTVHLGVYGKVCPGPPF